MSFIRKLLGWENSEEDAPAPKASTSSKNPDEQLRAFISKAPGAKYVFDSERDAPQSELCREGSEKQRKECIMIQMQSKRLFEAMQANGFFCALPLDPTQTHIECIPIPKK